MQLARPGVVKPDGDDSVRVHNQSANNQAAHEIGRDIESHASSDPVRGRIVPDVNSSDPEIKQSMLANQLAASELPAKSVALPKFTSLKRMSQHQAEIIGLFSAGPLQSAQLVSVDRTGQVLLWDMKIGQPGQLINLGFTVEAVAYLPTKALLSVAH
jgi:hypothetical protein